MFDTVGATETLTLSNPRDPVLVRTMLTEQQLTTRLQPTPTLPHGFGWVIRGAQNLHGYHAVDRPRLHTKALQFWAGVLEPRPHRRVQRREAMLGNATRERRLETLVGLDAVHLRDFVLVEARELIACTGAELEDDAVSRMYKGWDGEGFLLACEVMALASQLSTLISKNSIGDVESRTVCRVPSCEGSIGDGGGVGEGAELAFSEA